MKSEIQEEQKNNSLNNCTFIKTVLMFFVILYHSCLFIDDNWFPGSYLGNKSEEMLVFANFLNSFHIYAFVLVSGYIFCYIKCQRGGYQSFSLFTEKKVKRLLIPALFSSIVWAAPFGFFLFHYSLSDIIDRYLLASSPNQLWFLWMLFWVYLIGYALFKYWFSASGVFLVLSLYAVGIIGGKFLPNYFQVWTACKFVIIFWIGCILWILLSPNKSRDFIRWPFESWSNQIQFECKPNIIICMLFLTVDVLLFFVNQTIDADGIQEQLVSIGLELLLHIIGAITAFIVLQYIANSIIWDCEPFGILSKLTMPMYLFHQQIIYFIILLLRAYALPPWVEMLIIFAGAVIGSYIISLIMSRWNVTRILIGS